MNFQQIGLGVFIGIALTVIGWFLFAHRYNPADERNKIWYNHIMKAHNGWSYKYGNYLLISLDSGKTWYNTEREETNLIDTPHGTVNLSGYKNLTPADPKLVEHVEAFSKLTEVARNAKDGFFTKPDEKLLEKMGITVQAK